MSTTRRDFIKDAVALSSASIVASQSITGTANAQSGDYRRIAIEEIYCPPEIITALKRAIGENPDLEPGFTDLISEQTPFSVTLVRRMQDVGEERLAAMDAGGIDMALLSNWAPGVQIFSAEEGTELAALWNDRMAEVVAARPDRYAALATVAPQDPEAAAQEVERAMTTRGMKGVLINSHTHNEYLDDRKFWPVFEACEAHNAPIYLHPRVPSAQMFEPFSDYNMHSAKWGFQTEVATHVLRLISAGLFDEFPDLQLVLGHMGEGLPFWLHRLDSVSQLAYTSNLDRLPSEYLRQNTVISTSGMSWDPLLVFAHSVLGAENIMFATDYPFGNYAADTEWMDTVPLPEADKRLIYSGNAERVFNL
jgi:2,3-dihydroxybenzoate decarboxylase